MIPSRLTSAAQPPSRQTAATASSVGPSVIRSAEPSKIRSIPVKLVESVHAGLTSRLRALRVCSPVWKYTLPSYQAAPILAACGLPSGRTLPRKEAASASAPASSRSRARFHGSGSVSDVLSRLVVAVGSGLVTSLRPHRDGELIGAAFTAAAPPRPGCRFGLSRVAGGIAAPGSH